MKAYLDLLKDIRDNGTDRRDRTGVGVRSVFGRQLRFDLSQGFPLVTTRHIATKALFTELAWMIRGMTSNRPLEDQGCKIWKPWAVRHKDIHDCVTWGTVLDVHSKGSVLPYKRDLDKKGIRSAKSVTAVSEGDLGLLYGGLWRRWPTDGAKWVDIPVKDYIDPNEDWVPNSLSKEIPKGLKPSALPEHWDNQGNPFKLLGVKELKGRTIAYIQFEKDQVVTTVDGNDLLGKQVYGPYDPTLYQVACTGVPEQRGYQNTPLYRVWLRMIESCYRKDSRQWSQYGGRHAEVCKRWRCFEYFAMDVSGIPLYENWTRNPDQYALTHTYYGGHVFAPGCVAFVRHDEEVAYLQGHAYLVTSPGGLETTHNTLGQVANSVGVSTKIVTDLDRKLGEHDQGYAIKNCRVRRLPLQGQGTVRRRKTFVDQLAELIHNLIHNPFSRRHVISAWNPSYIPNEQFSPHLNVAMGNSALTACHCLFQFYVTEVEGVKRLSCMLTLRSNDMLIGNPFNVAGYAALTHVLAHLTQMEVGELILSIGDAHIYHNHFEGMERQLELEPLALPTLRIDPNLTSLDDVTADSFILENYRYHPAIKYPIAV